MGTSLRFPINLCQLVVDAIGRPKESRAFPTGSSRGGEDLCHERYSAVFRIVPNEGAAGLVWHSVGGYCLHDVEEAIGQLHMALAFGKPPEVKIVRLHYKHIWVSI